MMQVAIFLERTGEGRRGINSVHRHIPSAVRCTAPTWTSEMRMPQEEACRSECRLRHRLVLLPIPTYSPQPALVRSVSQTSRHSLVEIVAQTTPPSCPSLALVQEVSDCASCPLGRRLAPPCLVHDHVVERAALEAAEDGHVAGPQVRSAVRRVDAQHDVRELRRGCWPCPRERSTIVLPCMVSSRRPMWPRGARSWMASVLPACAICTRTPQAPRSMLKATVNVVASIVLPCSRACLTPRRLHPIWCSSRRRQDVSRSALTACVCSSATTAGRRAGACWRVAALGCGALSHTGRASCSSSACHAGAAGPTFGWDGRRVPLRRATSAPSL